jgi:general secretion pathway protein A
MDFKHFGCAELPFKLAFDTRFFYTNRSFQEAFLGLRYGIKLRRGVLVLTGDSGSGKTSLMRMVQDRSESNLHIVEISRPAQDLSGLLARIMRALGMAKIPADRRAMAQELRRYLMERLEQGHTVAVVLDDAQELDLDSFNDLESIADFHSAQQSLLQIVLVGRPELETKLQDPALKSFRQRATVWYRLAPLTTDETGAYIDHRLSCAGRARTGLFQPGAVERVAAYSKGIPGLINVICENALRLAYSAHQDDVTGQTIDKVWQHMQLTGECEFEVAALLAEIKLNSQPAEAHFKPVDAATRSQTIRKNNEPSRPREWRIGENKREWKKPRRNSLGALAMSSVIAILFLAGAALILYNSQSETSGPKSAGVVHQEQANAPAGDGVPGQASGEQAVAGNSPPIQTATSASGVAPPQTYQELPVVYVHTSEERDGSVLEEIINVLRTDGFAVRDARFSPGKTRGDVRFFFSQDRRDAERVKAVVQSELGKRGYYLSLQLLERDGKKFEHAAPGKIEVWLPPLSNAQRTG